MPRAHTRTRIPRIGFPVLSSVTRPEIEPVSLSKIVPVPVPAPMVAFTGRDNTTVNVSLGSTRVSSTRLIRTVLDVSPGAKVTGCALGS